MLESFEHVETNCCWWKVKKMNPLTLIELKPMEFQWTNVGCVASNMIGSTGGCTVFGTEISCTRTVWTIGIIRNAWIVRTWLVIGIQWFVIAAQCIVRCISPSGAAWTWCRGIKVYRRTVNISSRIIACNVKPMHSIFHETRCSASDRCCIRP